MLRHIPVANEQSGNALGLYPTTRVFQWRRVIFDISILVPLKLMKKIDSQGVRSEHPNNRFFTLE